MVSVQIQACFAAIAEELSPALAEAIATIGPIDLVPRRDAPFPEVLCRAVVGQQLSVAAARTIWGRVVDSATGSESQRSLIEHLAQAAPATLRACGLSAAKAKAMRAIAFASQAGELEADELSRLDHSERSQRLTCLWGVGQWTADMMGIFYFADPDIWPDGDVTARKTLEKLTSTRRKTIRTAARFNPNRSHLALYMWQYADAKPTE